MMSGNTPAELIERLRNDEVVQNTRSGPDPLCQEAADQLTVLTARVAGLESALRVSIWNGCKAKGMRDDDAYKRVNEEVAALTGEKG